MSDGMASWRPRGRYSTRNAGNEPMTSYMIASSPYRRAERGKQGKWDDLGVMLCCYYYGCWCTAVIVPLYCCIGDKRAVPIKASRHWLANRYHSYWPYNRSPCGSGWFSSPWLACFRFPPTVVATNDLELVWDRFCRGKNAVPTATALL